MSVYDIVNHSAQLSSPRSTFAGFGRPLVLHTFSAAQRTSIGASNNFVVNGNNWQTVLKSHGVTSSESIWVALGIMFSQQLKVDQAYIVSATDKVQQTGDLTVGEAVDGEYKVTIGDDVFSHVAASQTAVQIAAALAALIDADPKYTAPVPGTAVISYSITQAGIGETVVGESPNNLLSHTLTQAANGYVEDLVTFDTNVTTDYWAILETERNPAINLRLARYAQTQREKCALVLTTEAAAEVTGDTTHLGALAKALEIENAGIFYDPTITHYPEFGLAGKMLPKTPGSATWHMQQILNEVGIVPTNRSALVESRYNWNESFKGVTGSPTATQEGITPSGLFLDDIRGRDAFRREAREDLFFLLRELDKLDFSDLSVDQIVSVIETVAQRWDNRGFLDATTLTTKQVLVKDISPTARAARCIYGIEYEVKRKGAIHKIQDPAGGPGITGFLYA